MALQAKRQTKRAVKRQFGPEFEVGTRPSRRTPVIPALRFTTPRDATALTNDLRTLLDSRTRNRVSGAQW